MRTFTKLATFGLAAGGLAWWGAARRRRAAARIDDLATGVYRTSSVAAPAGVTNDAYDAVADSVAREDLEIAGDLETLELDVDVDEAAAADFASIVDEDVGTTSRAYVDVDRVYRSEAGEVRPDTGDLYGVHTAAASDTDLSADEDEDGFRGAGGGETWLEALEVASAEGGPVPEAEVRVVDDSDRESQSRTDHRDTPIADKGAAGPGGM